MPFESLIILHIFWKSLIISWPLSSLRTLVMGGFKYWNHSRENSWSSLSCQSSDGTDLRQLLCKRRTFTWIKNPISLGSFLIRLSLSYIMPIFSLIFQKLSGIILILLLLAVNTSNLWRLPILLGNSVSRLKSSLSFQRILRSQSPDGRKAIILFLKSTDLRNWFLEKRFSWRSFKFWIRRFNSRNYWMLVFP